MVSNGWEYSFLAFFLDVTSAAGNLLSLGLLTFRKRKNLSIDTSSPSKSGPLGGRFLKGWALEAVFITGRCQMGEGFSVRHPKKNVVLHNPQAKNPWHLIESKPYLPLRFSRFFSCRSAKRRSFSAS